MGRSRIRKILVVTGSRGEYGYIRPVLRSVEQRPDLDYELVATNMHLLPEFGSTINCFAEDGFHVDHEIFMALEGSTNASMSKSLGLFLMSFTDLIHNRRPDVILISGDRGEQFMAAVAGAHMNIPVAHIQAGEVSGNIDGLTRHAIARYAHLHFAANQDAADRLIRSGEQEFRVRMVGAPQLDDFLAGHFSPPQEVVDHFHLEPCKPVVMIIQHPVTEQASEAAEQMSITLRAVSRLGLQSVLVFPNNDAGSAAVRNAIEAFRGPWLRVTRTVPRAHFGGLMRMASAIVGNSSSGILEAPSFELPAVNIGRRQTGRVQGCNVLNVSHDEKEIRSALDAAISPDFRASLKGMKNPYGDGTASQKIVDALADFEPDETFLFKKLTY